MIDTSDKGDVADHRVGAAALRQRRHQRVRQHADERRARLRQDDPAGRRRRARPRTRRSRTTSATRSRSRPTPSSRAAASTPRSWSPTASPTSGTRAGATPAHFQWGNWGEPCLDCDCANATRHSTVLRRPRVPGRRPLRRHVPRQLHGVRRRQGRGRLARRRARPDDRPAPPAQGPHLGDRHQPGGRAVRAELHRLPRPHRRLRPLRPGRDPFRVRPRPLPPRGDARARTTARPSADCPVHHRTARRTATTRSSPSRRPQLDDALRKMLSAYGIGDYTTSGPSIANATTTSCRQHRLHHHRRVPRLARPRLRLRPEFRRSSATATPTARRSRTAPAAATSSPATARRRTRSSCSGTPARC